MHRRECEKDRSKKLEDSGLKKRELLQNEISFCDIPFLRRRYSENLFILWYFGTWFGKSEKRYTERIVVILIRCWKISFIWNCCEGTIQLLLVNG